MWHQVAAKSDAQMIHNKDIHLRGRELARTVVIAQAKYLEISGIPGEFFFPLNIGV